MSVATLLAELRSRDMEIWADGDQLRCNAPAGALTPEVREHLRLRKHDILEFLRSAEALARQQRAIVPLQPHGTRAPIFGVPGHSGDVFCYRLLAQHLGDDQPLFGLQPPGVDGQSEPLTRVEDLAAYFAAQILAYRPDDSYVIAGRLPQLGQRIAGEVESVRQHARVLLSLSSGERRRYITQRLRDRKARRNAPPAPPDPVEVLRAKVQAATIVGLRRYTPRHFDGRLSLFLPNKRWLRPGSPMLRWKRVARETEKHVGPDGCDGDHMLLESHVRVFADLFRASLMRGSAAI